jgi:hypothetical protein
MQQNFNVREVLLVGKETVNTMGYIYVYIKELHCNQIQNLCDQDFMWMLFDVLCVYVCMDGREQSD